MLSKHQDNWIRNGVSLAIIVSYVALLDLKIIARVFQVITHHGDWKKLAKFWVNNTLLKLLIKLVEVPLMM
jgi:hypothetical protein